MWLRQDRLTSAERLAALLNYGKPDRVPIGIIYPLEFSARMAGHPRSVNYTEPEKSLFSQILVAEMFGWDRVPIDMGHAILGALDFGGVVQIPENDYQQGIIVKSYPVKSEDDIEKLVIPDRRTAGRIALAKEFAQLQVSHDMQPWFLCRSPFTMAANICGLHQFCRWMIKKPELCHRLIRLALNHIIEVIDDWIDTFGANRLFIQMSSPSESNQLISSQYFRRFALPYYAQLFDRLRDMQIEHFMFHICGDQNANLPHLASLSSWPHPAILSFGHEVELEVAARLFPEDIIYGNVEPALIQESSPKQVYENCRQAIKKGKNIQSGFILGIGCVLPVESPPLNVFAITKAVNDFGWYE